MKNIIIIPIVLQFALVCYSQHQTHEYVGSEVSNRDTAGTIFGHLLWEAKPKILFDLPSEDSLAKIYRYPPFEPNAPFEISYLYWHGTQFFWRFPGKDWITPVEYREIYSYSPQDLIIRDIFQGGRGAYSMPTIVHKLDLFEMFSTYPADFDLFKTGTIIEVRARLYLQVDSLPIEGIYSDIDTIYLPPATPDDIAGLNYLKENNVNIHDFSRMLAGADLSLLQWEYVRDNFKNSIISEYAEYFLINAQFTRKRIQGEPYSQEEVHQSYVQLFKKLRNSKSEKIAERAKVFFEMYPITD
jgi:hypothetical protein